MTDYSKSGPIGWVKFADPSHSNATDSWFLHSFADSARIGALGFDASAATHAMYTDVEVPLGDIGTEWCGVVLPDLDGNGVQDLLLLESGVSCTSACDGQLVFMGLSDLTPVAATRVLQNYGPAQEMSIDISTDKRLPLRIIKRSLIQLTDWSTDYSFIRGVVKQITMLELDGDWSTLELGLAIGSARDDVLLVLGMTRTLEPRFSTRRAISSITPDTADFRVPGLPLGATVSGLFGLDGHLSWTANEATVVAAGTSAPGRQSHKHFFSTEKLLADQTSARVAGYLTAEFERLDPEILRSRSELYARLRGLVILSVYSNGSTGAATVLTLPHLLGEIVWKNSVKLAPTAAYAWGGSDRSGGRSLLVSVHTPPWSRVTGSGVMRVTMGADWTVVRREWIATSYLLQGITTLTRGEKDAMNALPLMLGPVTTEPTAIAAVRTVNGTLASQGDWGRATGMVPIMLDTSSNPGTGQVTVLLGADETWTGTQGMSGERCIMQS